MAALKRKNPKTRGARKKQRSRVTKRTGKRHTRAPTNYTAGVTTYKAKAVKQGKGTKKAKISKKMRNTIKSVMAIDRPIGHYRIQYLNGGAAYSGFSSDEQTTLSGMHNATDGLGWHFSVDHIINAASIAFNGAFTVASAAKFNPNLANRLADNTKLIVQATSSSYKLFNPSNRVIEVHVYEIAPKEQMPIDFEDPTKYWYLTSANTFTATTAALLQTKGMYDEIKESFEQDIKTNSVSTAAGTYSAVLPNTLNVTPNMSPTFRQKFKCNKLRDFKLEPGQDSFFAFKGPCNFTLDMEKMFDKGVYNNLQKWSRNIIFICKLDMTFSADAFGFGRAKASSVSKGGLCIERNDYYKFTAPENSSAGVKDVYIFDTEKISGSATTMTAVGDETYFAV